MPHMPLLGNYWEMLIS